MIMVSLALLGVFAIVATRLIGATVRVYREAGTAEGEARVVDSAVEELRHDVWGAREVRLAGPQSLSISSGAGRVYSWQVDASGALTRSETAEGKEAPAAPGSQTAGVAAPRQWREIGGRVSFEWDGAALVVRGADGGADRAGGIRVLSQIKLAESAGER